MLCVATPANENVKPSIIPVLASAYSILLKHRYDNLSAFHRLTTVIAIRGGLDERVSAIFWLLLCFLLISFSCSVLFLLLITDLY